jgi:hypothetical protein
MCHRICESLPVQHGYQTGAQKRVTNRGCAFCYYCQIRYINGIFIQAGIVIRGRDQGCTAHSAGDGKPAGSVSLSSDFAGSRSKAVIERRAKSSLRRSSLSCWMTSSRPSACRRSGVTGHPRARCPGALQWKQVWGTTRARVQSMSIRTTAGSDGVGAGTHTKGRTGSKSVMCSHGAGIEGQPGAVLAV